MIIRETDFPNIVLEKNQIVIRLNNAPRKDGIL